VLPDGTPGIQTSTPDGIAECAETLGFHEHRPVLVIVGGASAMEKAKTRRKRRIANEIRRAMDLAVVPAAAAAGAVVLTGGTNQGVMKIAGECFADRGARMLVGVAPRAKVIVSPRPQSEVPDDEAVLDSNHQSFVLTPGSEWGSETDTLFELAEHIAGDQRAGVVILANGGSVARHEAKRFLEAGWPVVTLAGSRRAADALVHAVQPSKLDLLRRRWRGRLRREWGDLSSAQVEVHHLVDEPVESLGRRLAWHLSDRHLLKNSLGSWAAYEGAAAAGKRLTRSAQGLSILLAGLLTVGSLVFGSYTHPKALGWLLVTLPVLVAVNGSVLDFLLPRRNWMVLRGAAGAAERAIYRYRARAAVADPSAETALVTELAEIRRRLLRSGVRNVLAPPVGRPALLSVAYDELGVLTVREYAVIRLDGQLTYYRSAAARLERLQLVTLALSALLAAGATWAAGEVFSARWVPVLVLIGATLVIAQQRSRWQDRIALYAAALADLQEVRDAQYVGGKEPDLGELVADVEDALERESSGWLQSAGRPTVVLQPFR
jgi:hypothetical protein